MSSSSPEISSLLARGREAGVFVLGSGITGRALAERFRSADFPLTVLDEKEVSAEVVSDITSIGAKLLSAVTPKMVAKAVSTQAPAFALLSPGISPSSPAITQLREEKIPIISEFDLAAHFCGRPLVAVTGTNGKSTTVSIIYQMLLRSLNQVELVGNIGRPFIDLVAVDQLRGNIGFRPINYVAELSSYQLEWAGAIGAHVAVLLNLAANHLERHLTLEAYLTAKARIFLNQSSSDFAILNADDPLLANLSRVISGTKSYFGTGEVTLGARLVEAERIVELVGCGDALNFPLLNSKLIGKHNRMNFAAAILASHLAGATAESIQEVIDTFPALEHRLEKVCEIDGVTFINDSKATTVASSAAVVRALKEEYPSRPIVLLVGGLAKQGDWTELQQEIPSGVKGVIGFGRDGGSVLSQLESFIPSKDYSRSCTQLAEALLLARSFAIAGDLVVLAPGCASFDSYSGFEERGRHFKSLVHQFSN